MSTATAPTSLSIEGEFNIYRASDLGVELLTLLRQPGDLELDLSQVSEMDSAGVQLLLAARAAAQETRRTLRVSATSEAVREALKTLGLADLHGEALASAAA